jgi:hypothetical protein
LYDALISEYDAERAAKRKSEKVVLNKGNAEEKKAKEAVKEEKPAQKVKIEAP